jgi:hypothetical protein
VLGIYASSSVALASTTQMGTGKILSLNNATGEVLTVTNGGSLGLGTTSPSALLGLDKRNLTGSVVGGIDSYLGFINSTESAVM